MTRIGPALLIGLLATSLNAQPLEIVTRFDYYFDEDTSATVLVFGDGWTSVEKLTVNGEPAAHGEPYVEATRFRIDISAYGAGDHLLPSRAVLDDGSHEDLTLHLRKLPARPNAVRVDRLTGGLMVDELPFFPFGFYASYPVGDLPVQEVFNAMNLIGVYQDNQQETLAGRRAYMDLCSAVGMKVNYSVNGLVGTPHNQTETVISEAEEERRWAALRREVETFKDHPALLSWYMNDEPVGQSRSPELLEKAFQIIKDVDPYHPVSVVFVIPDRAAPFANALDIAMTDPYPIPGDVDAVRSHMRSLARHFRFRKALWLVPQAFGGGEFWSREPTGPEIRTMTWLGILEGAMGIQYFIRRQPNLFPKSRLAWNEAVRVAHEVSMIHPWLFSDEPRKHLATGSERIRAVALPQGESTLILVTNEDNRPAAFNIDVSGIAHDASAHIALPFENRSVETVDHRLAETLEPLGTRAYLIRRNPEKPGAWDRYNLFPNPSFERFASPGVPMGAYADSDQRPEYDGSTYFLDSRVSHTGRNSLRFRAAHDTSHLALSFYQMYVDPGRTYHATLWSRRPVHAPPVTFTASIPELELRHDFSASSDWRRHDFRFKATPGTPSVRFRIETAVAGTFWVDDVAVVPDPMINVAVEHGPRAEVRIQSADPDAAISYRLNGTQTHTYSAPFEVREFTNVEVDVSHTAWPDDTLSFTVPLSVATLKKCSFVTPYSQKYAGAGDGTLVDGEYGSLAFRDSKYLGFDGKDVEFVIDLAGPSSIASIDVHFLVSPDDGIHAPQAVEAWTASRAATWTPLGRAENPEGTRHGTPYHKTMRIDGSLREAQLVRVKITSPRVIPDGYLFGGTDAWLFIDEVLVH